MLIQIITYTPKYILKNIQDPKTNISIIDMKICPDQGSNPGRRFIVVREPDGAWRWPNRFPVLIKS